MNWKLTDRIVAGAVFLYALVLYLLTVAPTASFWDAGEFIASVHGLQVMHPPGAPFYMLIGRLFSMFVPTAYVALSVNLISVLASALTVLLTHLIIVHLVRTWQGPLLEQTPSERLAALAGGAIGACAFAATDSFWFNAVEAEVYALSMLFTAAVVWLVMRWAALARREEETLGGRGRHPFSLASNRYLVLIAYLFGLATGVHLLNLLAIFYVALIIFFTEYDRPEWSTAQRWKGLAVAGAVSVVAFLVIYPGIITVLPDLAGASGVPFLFFIGVFALVAFAVYYTQKHHKPAWNLVALGVAVVLIGYSTYAFIFIRSAADPPIDLNDPETPESFVSYLKREQYGATPLFTGATFDNAAGRLAEGESYFPRRYSPDPRHQREYARYDSDLEFFLKYQVGHMYLRYFLWNFSGRASDVQDAPAASFRTASSAAEGVAEAPSEAASRNRYFALPLLLGLLGMGYHFMRDWRRAFAVAVLFFVTGLGIIIYLNQTPFQPRERDYSYVASFFAFSLWIGVGAAGLAEIAADALKTKAEKLRKGALLGVGALLFLAVPGLMAFQNYDDHDRSGRYIAPDYAYNLLQSLAPNAILFTNGDNDTYPLWYLQEVEGVRTDVRVVNLSLLNTSWYVDQLKNQWAGESAPLPISIPEEEIAQLGPVRWQPREVELPVDAAQLTQSDAPEEIGFPTDTSLLESPMRWRLDGRPLSREMSMLQASDIVAYNIIRNIAEDGWERPVYFAVTTGQDGQLDLQDYFQLEGQAFRVVPIRHRKQLGRVVPEVSYERMMQFRFRGLDDPDVYYDDNIRSMVNYYRTWFSHTAREMAEQGQPEKARALMNHLMDNVPFDTIPGTAQSYLLTAQAYEAVGDTDRMVALLQEAEPLLLAQLRGARTQQDMGYAAQYVQMIRLAYLDAGRFDAAARLSQALADILGDPSLAKTADELEAAYQGDDAPADTALGGGLLN